MGGGISPQIMKSEGFSPQIPKVVHAFLNDIFWVMFLEKSATLHYINLALIPRDWSKGVSGAQ